MILPVIVLLLLAVPLVGKQRLGKFAKARGLEHVGEDGVHRSARRPCWSRSLAIAIELEGLVNIEAGGWLALVGGRASAVAGDAVPARLSGADASTGSRAPSGCRSSAIVAADGRRAVRGGLRPEPDDAGAVPDLRSPSSSASCWCCASSACSAWLGIAGANNNRVLVLSAFVVAFAFPFTQNGSDANMSIAIAGADLRRDRARPEHRGRSRRTARPRLHRVPRRRRVHRGRRCRTRPSPTIDFKPPFIVTVLIAGVVASLLGLLIGAPTLRVSGDYLAIVTLAFGEIFRITMNNLDGNGRSEHHQRLQRHLRHSRPELLRLRLRRRAQHLRHRDRPVRQLLLADAGRDRA